MEQFNWILVTYNKNNKVLEELVIKKRIEGEAQSEAQSYVENHSEINDWSITIIDESECHLYNEL